MKKEEVIELSKEFNYKKGHEDKDTYRWILFGYNECAKLLNEKEQENKQLKDKLEFYSGLELDKTIDKTRLEYNKLQQENKKYKEVIDKAIEFTNKKWGTWCTHHLEYMTELQDILKEGKMNKEKDFFKTCFNTVAGLEVKNESQAIAKEVVLSEIENLQQENKELKKQVEEYENEPLTNKISRIDCVVSNIYSRNKTQRKEFIKYLENMLDDENDIFSVVRVKDVLQKYKEIIGVSNEY